MPPPPGPGGPGGPPPGGQRGGALFASPMGEPFRGDHPERAWFDGADTDHDGRISSAEMRNDAARFFAILDRARDGEIDPGDIEIYENQLFPELRTGGGGGSGGGRARGGPPGGGDGPPGGGGEGPGGDSGRSSRMNEAPQGAGRFGYLNLPEPVTTADSNLNRGVDAREFANAADDRFALLDANHDGFVTWAELPHVERRAGSGPRGGGGPPGGMGAPGRPPR